MGENIFSGLLYNISLLLMLALILTIFQDKVKSTSFLSNLALGFCIGLAGLLVMSTAVQLESGAIFDTRSILISVAGMFFGLIPTIIGVFMMIVYRIFIGGAGVYAGVLVILTTASIGVLWHHYRLPKILEKKRPNMLEFYFFGLIVHLDMLLCMFAFPKDQIFNVLQGIMLPVLLLYPIGTYLLCILLLNQFVRSDLIIKLKESGDRLNNIIEGTNAGIWEWNISKRELIINKRWAEIIGYTLDELAPVNIELFTRFTHPDDFALTEANLAQILDAKRDHFDIEFRMKHKNGHWVWVNCRGKVNSWTIDKKPLVTSGIHLDISKIKNTEAERAREIGLIISLLDSIPELVFYKDVEGVYLGCNIPFTEFVGKSKDEIVGRTDYDLFDKKVADFFRHQDREMLKQKLPRHNEEWITYPDGRKVLIDMLKTPYWDANGNLIGLIGISHDITEHKRKEEKIIYMSYHDQLTGLYNRRLYEEELTRLNVKRNLPLTIVMADINGLKLINDSFGHGAGDELIKKVAKIIQQGFRADDIIARYGGDEFVIVLPKTDASETERIISRIKESLHQEEVYGIRISVAFGFATKINEQEKLPEILKKSEDDMYRHKLYESSSMRSKTIDLIINTLYEKNHREMMHSKRVSEICGSIATEMGMDINMISQIRLAGLVHDIGKIGIDERILNSSQKLNEEEWREIQKHSEIGYRILSSVNEFSEIAEYVLEHQEKWDGTGYPRGLKGKEISLQARIIAIADVFDAMTSYRTYGKEKTEEEAINEIKRCSGTQFDPEIVEIFIRQHNKSDRGVAKVGC